MFRILDPRRLSDLAALCCSIVNEVHLSNEVRDVLSGSERTAEAGQTWSPCVLSFKGDARGPSIP